MTHINIVDEILKNLKIITERCNALEKELLSYYTRCDKFKSEIGENWDKSNVFVICRANYYTNTLKTIFLNIVDCELELSDNDFHKMVINKQNTENQILAYCRWDINELILTFCRNLSNSDNYCPKPDYPEPIDSTNDTITNVPSISLFKTRDESGRKQTNVVGYWSELDADERQKLDKYLKENAEQVTQMLKTYPVIIITADVMTMTTNPKIQTHTLKINAECIDVLNNIENISSRLSGLWFAPIGLDVTNEKTVMWILRHDVLKIQSIQNSRGDNFALRYNRIGMSKIDKLSIKNFILTHKSQIVEMLDKLDASKKEELFVYSHGDGEVHSSKISLSKPEHYGGMVMWLQPTENGYRRKDPKTIKPLEEIFFKACIKKYYYRDLKEGQYVDFSEIIEMFHNMGFSKKQLCYYMKKWHHKYKFYTPEDRDICYGRFTYFLSTDLPDAYCKMLCEM